MCFNTTHQHLQKTRNVISLRFRCLPIQLQVPHWRGKSQTDKYHKDIFSSSRLDNCIVFTGHTYVVTYVPTRYTNKLCKVIIDCSSRYAKVRNWKQSNMAVLYSYPTIRTLNQDICMYTQTHSRIHRKVVALSQRLTRPANRLTDEVQSLNVAQGYL